MPLYHQHAVAVFAFIRSRVIDGPTAEDMAQQVWLNVHRHLGEGGAVEGNPLAWLIRVAKNAIIDPTRRQRPGELPKDADMADPDGSALDRVMKEEDSRRLRECISRLPPEWAGLIRRRFTGEKAGEIAEKTGSTPERVSRVIFQAKQQLRECMDRDRGSP